MSNLNFDVVEPSGLSQKEFGRLCGVSRVTANKWINGQARPNIWLEPKARDVLHLVAKAVEFGKLPVKAGPGDEARSQLIAEALQATADLIETSAA